MVKRLSVLVNKYYYTVQCVHDESKFLLVSYMV